jgi:hypothetical protein
MARPRDTRRGIEGHAGGGGVARRLLVAALLACAAFLVLAPGAFAASSISGKVSEKLSNPLSGIQVQVLTASREPVAFAETHAGGEYTVPGLAPGTYKVEFRPPFESIFAAQYYEGATSFSAAKPVEVKEGENKPNINAVLREGGKISGTVKGPHGEPVQGVDVAALGEEFFGFATTDAAGKYTVKGLAKDSYKVEFATFELETNLVPQFYNGARSFGTATPVEVKEEETKLNVNAVLEEGGEISGTVTDAATNLPLSEVCVTANNSLGFEFFGGEAETTANGKYTIHGLEKGSYNLEFEYCPFRPGVQYIKQLVNGVSVSPGLTSGINVALVRRAPFNTVRPELSGTPAVGQTLSCSTGSWTGVQPLTFTYSWLRDGAIFAGASGSTYVVQPADQGHDLACRVTAKNSVASVFSNSRSLKVQLQPPPPPPPPPLTLESLSQSNSRWREGGKLASYSRRRPPVGTTFRFVLNQQAVASFAFTQQVGGRKVGGKCVAQTRANRRRPGCRRTVTQGTLTFLGHSGLNRVAFQGRISRSKRLPLGAYTLKTTAVNSAGQRSSTRSLNFTIVR